ncbi:MAG: hypothetical protein HZB42_11925 [Sphingobacteriales bacterium]|nr:hypothetical protein [Sphingobacteriales bacterium]
MKKILIALLLGGLILSCNQQKKSNVSEHKSDSIRLKQDTFHLSNDLEDQIGKQGIASLIDSAIERGDSMAYNKVSNYYLINQLDEEFLFPAMIMANRYKDRSAYFDVYDILTSMRYDNHLEKMDEQTKAIALYYLLRSYELGYENAKYEVEELFTDKKLPIPKSSDFIVFK